VIERLGRRPHAAQHVQVFVGAAIARVVVEPVAVPRLLGIAATRDDVQRKPTTAHQVIEAHRLTGGEAGRDKAGAVREQELEVLGRGPRTRHRREPRHGRASGRTIPRRPRR
jgi:hypothetical protein